MSLSAKALATRESILNAANELFYLNGYNATGIDKVIKVAEVTKGNFYYHFKSKEALAIASLDWHYEITAKQIQDNVLSKNLSSLDTLLSLLDLMANRQKDQHKNWFLCCFPYGNFTLELSTASAQVRNKLKSIFDHYLQTIEMLLSQARLAGEVPQHIDPIAMSAVILSQLEGAILLDKANQKPYSVDNSIKFIKQYLSV